MEDPKWNDFDKQVYDDCVANELTVTDVHEAWRVGLTELLALKRQSEVEVAE